MYLAFSGSVPLSQNITYQASGQQQILPHSSFRMQNLLISSLKMAETLGRVKFWCKVFIKACQASGFTFSFLPSSCLLCLARDSSNFCQVSHTSTVPLRKEGCPCEPHASAGHSPLLLLAQQNNMCCLFLFLFQEQSLISKKVPA